MERGVSRRSGAPQSDGDFTDNGRGKRRTRHVHSLVRSDHSSGRNEPVAAFRLPVVRDRRTVSTTLNVGELLNLVGLSTGVVLYAMLLAMVVRAGRTPGLHVGFDPLLLADVRPRPRLESLRAAGVRAAEDGDRRAVPVSGGRRVRRARLPAGGRRPLGAAEASVMACAARSKRSLAAIAYAVSAVAALLHLYAGVDGRPVPSPLGMRLLTYTFVALVVPLAAVTRGQPGAGRALWAAALATFAVSALHLSQLHRGEASWPVELVGHHASLPLAFAILYQDYPFALADLFLKRALALLAIVAVAFAAIATFGVRSAAFAQFVQADPQTGDASWSRCGSPPRCCIRSCAEPPLVRRHDRPASARLPIAASDDRAHVAGQRRRPDAAVDGLRTARASAERRVCDLARVDVIAVRMRALGAVVIGGSDVGGDRRARRRRTASRAAGDRASYRPTRSAAFRHRHRPADRRPPAVVGRSRHAGSDRRRRRAAHRRHPDHERAVRARDFASRKSASWRRKRSCARSARKSIRTSCSTR